MPKNKTNVLPFKTKRKEYHLTDAKIKKLPTRTARLDAWKEEVFKSDRHQGLAIRRTPKGKRSGLPKEFTDRWICTGTPKGEPRNIKIVGVDPSSITVKKAISWFNDQKALMQQGINPNKKNKESRDSDEPTIIELAEMHLRNAPLKETSKGTYKNYIERIKKIVGNKTFTEFRDHHIEKLVEGASNDYHKNLVFFLNRLYERLAPKYKGEESIMEVYHRVIDKHLPPSKSRIETYLAYEPHHQQIAQWFLAIKYSTDGYLIKQGSRYRGERVRTADLMPDLSSKEKELAGFDDDYGLHTSATNDRFIEPCINFRSETDALFFMFLTGLRKENVRILKWDHINWDTNTIIIKGMKYREEGDDVQIRLTTYTKAILEYRQKQKRVGDVFIFPNENTRQPLGISTLTAKGYVIPIWACLLDFTNEYENIRGLTLDRQQDMNNPKTYQKNPLRELIEREDVYSEPIDISFPKLFSQLKQNQINISIKEAERKGILDQSVRHLVHKLGFSPHALRRTASNIANLLGYSPRIILRHSEKTTERKSYTSDAVSSEAPQLEKIHQYIDNRIFESLGKESDMNEEIFLSPILNYYEQPLYIPQDDYFQFGRHTGNIYGKEKETLASLYRLPQYATELQPKKPVEEVINEFEDDF